MHSANIVAKSAFVPILLVGFACVCLAQKNAVESKILQEFWTDDELHIASAIARLVEKTYLPMTTMVDVLMAYSNQYEKYNQEQFMDEILKRLPLLTVRLDFTLSMRIYAPRQYLLIMADKPESFRNALMSLSYSPYDFAGYVIIIFTDFVQRWELNHIFRVCLEYNVVDVILILPHKKSLIKLYTYYPFVKGNCYNSVKNEFCQFERGKFIDRMGNECDLFPNKIDNFHNCEFYANVWEIPPEMIYTQRIFGKGRLEGFEGEMIHTLARMLKFSLRFNYWNVFNYEQSFDQTRSTGDANFSVGRNYYPKDLLDTISPSITYYTSRLVLVAHVGQPLNFMELVVRIMEHGLWLVLLLMILIPFLVVFLLFRVKRSIREYVIGDNNSIPYYNVIVTIFGGAAHFKPRRNIAGYIFVGWLWMTLIFRQGYQSTLYNYMRFEPRAKMPQTLDELILRGEKIGSSPLLYNIILDLPQFDPRIFILFNRSEQQAMRWLEYSNNRKAIITPMESFRFFQQTFGYRRQLYALREPVFSMKICIQHSKRSYLKRAFDSLIMSMMSAGLINYWDTIYTSKLVNLKNVSQSTVTEKRNLFRQLEDFDTLIIVYFVMVGVAFLVLLLEIGMFPLKRDKIYKQLNMKFTRCCGRRNKRSPKSPRQELGPRRKRRKHAHKAITWY